uniref:Capsid protein n=1 Tax=viral metagenome TaxID=1070528 RepID=A0A6M3XW37_9ZZZZ
MAQGPVTLASAVSLSDLTDLVRRNWTVMKATLPRKARSLFNSEYIGAGQGSSKRIQEFDGETFAAYKAEGTNSEKAQVGSGYSVDMTARTFSKEIDITLEMRTDNRYPQIGQLITDLASFCENRQDLDLTHRVSFATSMSYTDMNGESVSVAMGDTYALAYATHTLAHSPTTYSNRVTGDPAFSQGAYESGMLLATTQTFNNFGEQRVLDWNTVITGTDPSTVRAVKQFLNSQADVDSVQSGIVNVYKDAKRHIELPYLASTAAGAYDSTKRRWWGVIAVGMSGWQAYVGDWIAPTLKTPGAGNNGEDIHSLNWTYSAYCRFGIAVVSGKGIVMSCPSS